MKLNLGCGTKILPGYVNVDIRPAPGVDVIADLSKLPWSWKDGEVDEVVMLDFLEHFPYRQTEPILQEVWRVLKPGGTVDIQVPDFEHCARAAEFRAPFTCNRCGWVYPEFDPRANFFICDQCKQPWLDCALAATHRLMGGQDYSGNWHYALFTKLILRELLYRNGFSDIEEIERNENGETYYQNWNFKYRAHKSEIGWDE